MGDLLSYVPKLVFFNIKLIQIQLFMFSNLQFTLSSAMSAYLKSQPFREQRTAATKNNEIS